MTRVLILGATGMLGHKLVQGLRTEFEVAGTVRAADDAATFRPLFGSAPLYADVRADEFSTIERAVDLWRADVVVNCIGLVKQKEAARDPVASIEINSLLPHRLARLAAARGARLIHFSTDCVFSGTRGNYGESDIPDPTDLYGRSKLLGEVDAPGALTLRTSMVGRELRGHVGLVDWFLAQRGSRIRGFARAIYTGLTTLALTELVGRIIASHQDLCGVWQVSSEPISKFALLHLIDKCYGLNVAIERDETFVCDRSLDSSRFRARTGWSPLSWPKMIEDMHAEEALYAD